MTATHTDADGRTWVLVERLERSDRKRRRGPLDVAVLADGRRVRVDPASEDIEVDGKRLPWRWAWAMV